MAHSDLIGGSTAERVLNCTASVELCRKMPKQGSSAFADQGTMLHNAMEEILTKGRTPEDLVLAGHRYGDQVLTLDLVEEMIEPALKAFDDLVDMLDDGDLQFRCEQRVGYEGLDAFGTTDILGFTKRYVVVADWKFGRGVKVRAEGNYQWRFYGGAAMEMHPEMFEGRRVVGAIIQPAAEEPLTWEIIDTDELQQFVTSMKVALADIAAGNTVFATGKWCRWCSGGPICPTKRRQAVELLRQDTDPGLDPDELGELVRLAAELEDWTRSVLVLAHQELEKGREVTGYKLVAKKALRYWTDEDKAEALLRKYGVNNIHKVELISPAQAEKALKGSKIDLSEVIVSRSSGTTMAPVADKRPAVTPTAPDLGDASDFKGWNK